MSLHDAWGRLASAFNQRALRERALISLTLVILLLFFGWQFVVSPLWSRNQDLADAIAQLHQQQSTFQGQVVNLQQRLKLDPNAPLRRQQRALQQQKAQLQKRLRSDMATLVSPEAMVPLLRRMLKAQKGLKLIAVEHLPPRPIVLAGVRDDQRSKGKEAQAASASDQKTSDPDGAEQPALYAHDVQLVVSGSFFSVLDYLQNLESMHQRFGWRLLKYEVKDYPRAEVHLQVETLSLSKEWLGV